MIIFAIGYAAIDNNAHAIPKYFNIPSGAFMPNDVAKTSNTNKTPKPIIKEPNIYFILNIDKFVAPALPGQLSFMLSIIEDNDRESLVGWISVCASDPHVEQFRLSYTSVPSVFKGFKKALPWQCGLSSIKEDVRESC